jgi:acetyl-CoA carboxylase, biotin carboxylase subunit
VQILGDGDTAIHLYERECSLQRRRPKVWEEAPVACLTLDRRETLCASAVNLAASVRYRGAGTLEYLYDETSGEFFFIEMNTRIQVEHPITEMITGIDLVQAMLRIADGEPLPYKQSDVVVRGYAIEVRINAEDPARASCQRPDASQSLRRPLASTFVSIRRFMKGYVVLPFYDSLLGKLIVHGDTREKALDRVRAALEGLSIEGIATTRALYLALLDNESVRSGSVHTRWLEGWLEQGFSRPGTAT